MRGVVVDVKTVVGGLGVVAGMGVVTRDYGGEVGGFRAMNGETTMVVGGFGAATREIFVVVGVIIVSGEIVVVAIDWDDANSKVLALLTALNPELP